MENQQPEIDRHKFPRIKSSNLVAYEISESYDQDTEGLGITQNISLGGLMLEVNRSFPVNTVIEIELALFDKTVKAKGRVIHIQDLGNGKYDLGMKFIEITQEHFNILWEYLEQKKKNFL